MNGEAARLDRAAALTILYEVERDSLDKSVALDRLEQCVIRPLPRMIEPSVGWETLHDTAIEAFRHRCGVLVDINNEQVIIKPSWAVPLGEVWSNTGGKVVVPPAWLQEARGPA